MMTDFATTRTRRPRRLLMIGLAAALIALGAALATVLIGSVSAEDDTHDEDNSASTMLTIEGVASRSVSYDGTTGRFTVSVLKPTVLAAVSAGNTAAKAVAEAVEENCTVSEPDGADHTAPPTCISPSGLQTTRIRIHEEFDWTERGRVSQGFRYENSLSIAIRGTGFAGGLVDLVIRAGGDDVRFDGLDFTTSRRAEIERMVLLDAIDDAQATARSIAKHMKYEIVRIVELEPSSNLSAAPASGETEERAMADDSAEPTPVFGGSKSITARVRLVFELRPQS